MVSNCLRRRSSAVGILSGALLATSAAGAREVRIAPLDSAGVPVSGFRWLVELDQTHRVVPGVSSFGAPALQFERSHAPSLSAGETRSSSATVQLDDGRRYFISVLPYEGYTNSGVALDLTEAPAPDEPITASVVVDAVPLETAQISVFAFQDHQPINGTPDLPEEVGLGGFEIVLFDAAGQYGAAGGQVTQDAFGNPLGTTYLPNGEIERRGNGVMLTGPDGTALIRNLPPAKYGVQLVPPAGLDWHQTSTIEGTKTNDAWVKSGEPSYFQEFGPPGHHVFTGFVNPTLLRQGAGQLLQGSASLSGRITNLHMSRSPQTAFFGSEPFAHVSCWVGLNDSNAGNGPALLAQPCREGGVFHIDGVAPGTYELVIWDEYLDLIIASRSVTVAPEQGELALGDIPVFNWFGRLEHVVFLDDNQNGVRDAGESGIPTQNVNLRFKDGRIYQAFGTDPAGVAPFDEVFPFFHWLVAEVDYTRFKPTGVSVWVDDGGAVDVADPFSLGGLANPQPQSEAGGADFRTELGPVLTQGVQQFLGQTSRLEWGKAPYGPSENGGISGMVRYAVTRAENDPVLAVGEEWEPGIPRVQLNLYADANGDGQIDDIDGEPGVTRADVDNYPLGWFEGASRGLEDLDRNDNGVFDRGDALRVTFTDSWDDAPPTGCQGSNGMPGVLADDACFDGLRNFNQIRPAVFDGGYAFGIGGDAASAENQTNPAAQLLAGSYVVETAVPPGYELLKEEDKNVDFGLEFEPGPIVLALPPRCAGDPHRVPPFTSFQLGADGAPVTSPESRVEAPFAGELRPLCDRKPIRLTPGRNAAVDFFLFSQVPKAAKVSGMILDDTANEFDPNAPTFGEKFAPPFLPVAFRDYTGREIARVYADEWGKYNALLPSTFSVNLPMPSGVSPNMLTACINDAGPIPDSASTGGAAPLIIDPYYDRRYSQFCYTFQYMPGATTYLDTPVLPIAAHAGASEFALDCEQPSGTPLISSVLGPDHPGPYVEVGPNVDDLAQLITLTSVGPALVTNPAFGAAGEPPQIARDYGFGNAPGLILLGDIMLDVLAWSDRSVTALVPDGANSGQLRVERSDGNASPLALTLTVGPIAGNVHVVNPERGPSATPIQDAIDASAPQDLILVAPGVYDELPIVYKPLYLQGAGAFSVTLSARKTPAEKLALWRAKLAALLDAGAFSLLPGQATGFDPADNEPALFTAEEGAALTVLAASSGPMAFGVPARARIDGLTLTGSDGGGGIFVNGYARDLEISNNRVQSNQGNFGGGIRVGHADLVNQDPALGLVHTDAENDRIRIHHNLVLENGTLGGTGGGIALYTGADAYRVSDNYVCGNFAQTDGAGIGHLGASPGGAIEGNTILFNESFNQGAPACGGGVFIGGKAGLGAAPALTTGAGSVSVAGNLIQGNQAGAGNGGGVCLQTINGQDVLENPDDPSAWHRVVLTNDMIVDNVAGAAGGGISLQDAVSVEIDSDTIANNDSTATAAVAFPANDQNQSAPQIGGIASHPHTAVLAAAFGDATRAEYGVFSQPTLQRSVVWHNRSFSWRSLDALNTNLAARFGLVPDLSAGEAPVYADLGVLGGGGALDPQSCILTDVTDADTSNISVDPGFISEYFNGHPGQSLINTEVTTALDTAVALDEGGNFIDVHFGPLTPMGDYHLSDPGDIGADAIHPRGAAE
jgi:hypothetical protein